jgi:hypothetical protein
MSAKFSETHCTDQEYLTWERNSTLSDYMITLFKDRHSGMDSRQAVLPGALWVNANLLQTDLWWNPGAMDGFKLTLHGTGYPLPGGYDELPHNHLKILVNHRGAENTEKNHWVEKEIPIPW